MIVIMFCFYNNCLRVPSSIFQGRYVISFYYTYIWLSTNLTKMYITSTWVINRLILMTR